MAIVAEGSKGRLYLPITEQHERVAVGEEAPEDDPDTDLPKHALGFRVQDCGMYKHRQLFANRQLRVLTTLADVVEEIHVLLAKEAQAKDAYGDAIATYLALAVSRITHSWSNLSTGHSGGEKIRTPGINAEPQGAQTYRVLWEEAIKADPDWVLITSWNEWHEGRQESLRLDAHAGCVGRQ